MKNEGGRMNRMLLRRARGPAVSRRRRALFAFFLSSFVLLSSSLCSAESGWVLTTADFQSRPVDLRAIDPRGITIADEKGQATTIPVDQFLQLARAGAPQPVKSKFVLSLTTGDTVAGDPVGVKDEVLTWNAAALGELKVPLRQVVAVRRPGVPVPAAAAQEVPTEDTVRLANGDAVKGIVVGMEPGTVSVQVGTDVTPVPSDAVVAITFASTGGASGKPDKGRGFRVRLSDGSSLVVPGLAWESGTATLQVGNEKRRLDASKLAGIEQVNGPVTWLSSVEPTESEQVPYLGQPWPARMDRSVSGGPIRVGAQTFARGIGVHAYSRLAWNLDGSHKTFRTRYAIDGDREQADVTVRVRLDDKVVHEQQHVRAGRLADVVRVELGDAKRLTLEVDFGDGYDVQDRLNWIEPALVK
jgi:hypothetical protein